MQPRTASSQKTLCHAGVCFNKKTHSSGDIRKDKLSEHQIRFGRILPSDRSRYMYI